MWKILAFLALAPSVAGAQEVLGRRAITVISEGTPLSSAQLSEPYRPALPGMLPTGTRIHELFISYRGNLYLCYLRGATDTGTPPYAGCFGPELDD